MKNGNLSTCKFEYGTSKGTDLTFKTS